MRLMKLLCVCVRVWTCCCLPSDKRTLKWCICIYARDQTWRPAKGRGNNPHFHIESTGSASRRGAAVGRRGILSLLFLDIRECVVVLFFFVFLQLLLWLWSRFLYVLIYSGIVDDSQNTFEQPCAGTVTVNLYLTRKIRVDFWTMLFFPMFPQVALFCIAANLSNYFLVTASLLSVQIDVYLARGARQKAWGFFGFV